MRKTLLTATLVAMSLGAYADSPVSSFFKETKKVELPSLKFNHPEGSTFAKELNKQLENELAKNLADEFGKGFGREKMAVNPASDNRGIMNVRAAAAKGKERLDSIVSVNAATQEVLSKFVYAYDEQDYPSSETRYYMNSETGMFEFGSEKVYVWSADGFLLEQWSKSGTGDQSYGDRTVYELGEYNEILSREMYYLQNEEWIPSTKTSYVYLPSGDVAEETNSYYNTDSQEWVIQTKYTGEYNENGQLVKYVEFAADYNMVLLPKITLYEYYEDGNLYTETEQQAFESPDNIMNMTQRVYEYNEMGLKSIQHFNKWNSTRQNWDGGEPIGQGTWPEYNVIIEYSYYDNGNPAKELISSQSEPDGDFKPVSMYTYDYVDDETGGGYTYIFTQSNIYEDGAVNPMVRIEEHYNDWGGIDKRTQSYDYGMGLSPETMSETVFDENHFVIETINYRFDMFSGERMNNMKSLYERNDSGNYTSIEDFRGDYNDPTAWIPFRLITQDLTPDNQVLEYAVKNWDAETEEYVLDVLTGFEYDFNVPASDILTWFDYAYPDFLYKITKLIEEYSVGRAEGTLYYSDGSSVGVDAVLDGEGVCEVYNVKGFKVGTVEASALEGLLSGLEKGIYIVKNGAKTVKIVR